MMNKKALPFLTACLLGSVALLAAPVEVAKMEQPPRLIDLLA